MHTIKIEIQSPIRLDLVFVSCRDVNRLKCPSSRVHNHSDEVLDVDLQ